MNNLSDDKSRENNQYNNEDLFIQKILIYYKKLLYLIKLTNK